MFLKELRSKCEERAIPIISQATENFLREILLKYKPKTYLEIGSAVGYSSIFVASIINQRHGQVYAFEISYPAYLEGLMNIRQSKTYNITSYPFSFLETNVTKLLPTPVDFIFVDGQKNQYAKYLEKSESLFGNTTLIVLDDVIKYHNKLESLYGFLEKKQINYKVMQLEPDDGVMVLSL